jgi:hypothetical protein
VLAVAVVPVLVGCGGKSERQGAGNGPGDGGGGASGSSGNGGTSGSSGRGGSGGTSGSSGSGGIDPSVTVFPLTNQSPDKADLLFMIDNSISMAHKQRLLAEAMPVLLARLLDPICVDELGNPTGGTASLGCVEGEPEFQPVTDLHVGIITSSLGGHGGDVCANSPPDPTRNFNDAAQLLPSVRAGVYSYKDRGFLAWDPRTERPSPDPHPDLSSHEMVASDFAADLTDQVAAVGERGCGYEASLEAWYRFLVDPEPISDVTVVGSVNVRGPVNDVVLRQRADFLRPDSLLAIVMLTDENDCSINDENGAQGWLVGRRALMPRGSDACAHPEDPNVYRCCIPCVLIDASSTPSGCDYDDDVACGAGHSLTMLEDSINLRCFKQIERFGVDLLYPWQRYVDGLTQRRLSLGNSEVMNPLYTPGDDGTPAREDGRIFLAGVLGVPWQDLATAESLNGRRLTYLTASEMSAPRDADGVAFGPNRWDVVLGDPDLGKQPLDPFMIESVSPRPLGAANPVPGAQAAITAPSQGSNSINGHEQNIPNFDDLQYACTFPLEEPIPCTQSNGDGCECNAAERDYSRPTCAYSGEGDGTQTHAKAYPSTRQLQVLKGFGNNAVVASICPKNTRAQGSPADDPDYGYNPAMSALVRRLGEGFMKPCFPRPLVATNGEVACRVVEASPATACTCDAPGRSAPSSTLETNVEAELTLRGQCGGSSGVSCSDYCLCEIEQLSGSDLDACQNQEAAPDDIYGFCYVDPDQGFGNPSLVSACPATQRQLVRFVGSDVPRQGASAFIVCD